MAQWNTNVKHEPSSINNGNQYEKKDRVSREQLNALAENSFYAINKSEEAINKANSAFEANGTLVTINGAPQTSWSADFAESERQKSLGKDGVIVHANEVYPVGSIYMSVNETSPASFFGGTWERLKDKFLLGAGDTYENGATGGIDSHTHTLESGSALIGQRAYSNDVLWSVKGDWQYMNNRTVLEVPLDPAGYEAVRDGWDLVSTKLGGTTDWTSHMPPYLTVYMWKRVG